MQPDYFDTYFDAFFDGYVEAALWSSMNPDAENRALDMDYSPDDLARETRRKMIADCRAFIRGNEAALDDARRRGLLAPNAGRAFWLTRNRHGTGFWDRGLGALGARLTRAAYAYGEVDLYVSRGKIRA